MSEIKGRIKGVTSREKWAARGASFVAKTKATKAVWFPPKPLEAGGQAVSTATKTGTEATKRSTGAAKSTARTTAKKSSGAAKRTGKKTTGAVRNPARKAAGTTKSTGKKTAGAAKKVTSPARKKA